MPDESSRVFEVVCKGCSRSLMTVERLRDPEIDAVVGHLRACPASEPLGDTPMLGAVMRGLRVTTVDHQLNSDSSPDETAITAKTESR